MPEEQNFSFGHEILEADIQRLVQEIKAQKERETIGNLSDKEIVKEALKSLADLPQSQPSQSQNQSSQSSQSRLESSSSFLPDYIKDASPEIKLEVEYLLDLAFHEGLAKANAEAKKSSPFILDAFHDALVGKIYPELQKRGIVR